MPTPGRLKEIPKGRGISESQFCKQKYDTKMVFLEGWRVQFKKPSCMGGVWIFSETTHCMWDRGRGQAAEVVFMCNCLSGVCAKAPKVQIMLLFMTVVDCRLLLTFSQYCYWYTTCLLNEQEGQMGRYLNQVHNK